MWFAGLHQKGLYSEGQRKPGRNYRAIMEGLVAQMDALDAAVKEVAHSLPNMPTDAKRRLSKVREATGRRRCQTAAAQQAAHMHASM